MTQSLPASKIVPYLYGLLQSPWMYTCTYLAQIVGVSHDSVTRSLHARYPWKHWLWSLVQKYSFDSGYLIIDETEIDKLYAKLIPHLSWFYSHKQKKYTYGLYLVVVVWTNGTVTIPVAWKIYQAGSGKTKIDLAHELILYCLLKLHIKPRAWLFDAFYSAESLLALLESHHQYYYSQLPKNRLFDQAQLRTHQRGRPYWTKVGYIKGKHQVQIVKNRRKYYITNEIGIPRQKQLDTYRLRWRIEEVFRFTKDQLGLEECQSTSLTVQHNHIGACFLLYGILQDTMSVTSLTAYQAKQRATLDRDYVKQIDIPAYVGSA